MLQQIWSFFRLIFWGGGGIIKGGENLKERERERKREKERERERERGRGGRRGEEGGGDLGNISNKQQRAARAGIGPSPVAHPRLVVGALLGNARHAPGRCARLFFWGLSGALLWPASPRRLACRSLHITKPEPPHDGRMPACCWGSSRLQGRMLAKRQKGKESALGASSSRCRRSRRGRRRRLPSDPPPQGSPSPRPPPEPQWA